MEVSNNTRLRLYELAFSMIIKNLSETIGNEKLDYFMETFCKTFAIDFTSMQIVKNMYAKKMQPTKRELALYCIYTKTPYNRIAVDYRTLRKYRKEWEINGKPEMQPHVINSFLQPIIKSFVDSYLSLMYDNLVYIKEMRKFE